MQQNNQSISANEKYGIVVSLKDTFGFIQLFLTEENFYFSIKDCVSSIVVSDEVCFLVKDTIKGKVAYRVQPTDLSSKVIIENVSGTVTREAETKRGPFGVITVIAEGNENEETNIPFLYEDIVDKTKKIFKGDTVAFKLFTIPNTPYKRATKVVMTQSRKDKLFKQQVKQLASTGAVAEQGFVDSICHDFGFIRKVDGDNKLYFRLEDVLDENKRLSTGTEVSFFIINEKTADQSKKDRAVHVSILPPGTVSMETTLHLSVLGVVSQEAVINPHEVPGEITLHTPVSGAAVNLPLIEKVELWGRCLSDGLIAKVGDELEIDVTKYRPENLVFARNVIVKAFRTIGREYGRICRVRENGFGFIRSVPRDVDIYFRTAEVIGVDGKVVKESLVREGLTVTYDVCEEEKSSVSRLRAIRVQLDDNVENASRVITIKAGMLGIITREAKKDVPGILRVTSDLAALRTLEKELLYKDLKVAVTAFQQSPYLNEVTLEFLSPPQRLAYYTIIENSFTNISIEKIPQSNRTIDDIKLCSLKLKKLKPQEYANWLRNKTNNNNDILDLETTTNNNHKNRRSSSEAHSVDHMDSGYIYFQRIHFDDTHGPATINSEVTFELCLDKKFSKLVGKSVKVSDGGVDGDQNGIVTYHGIIESANQKNGKFGYLRCIETDEKLFWQTPATAATNNGTTTTPPQHVAAAVSGSPNIKTTLPTPPSSNNNNNKEANAHSKILATSPGTPETSSNSSSGGGGIEFKEGMEVSFEIRLRGGHRRGINLQPLPKGSLSKEIVLEGVCLAVVTDESHVVLIDVSACPNLVNKYSNLIAAIDTLTKNDKKTIQRGTALPNPSPNKDNKASPTPVPESTESNGTTTTTNTELTSTGNIKVPYPLLHRVPIAIENTLSLSLRVGELVNCQAVVNWALQRQPLRVCHITKTSPSPSATVMTIKKKGVVRKVKISIDEVVFTEVVELRTPGSEVAPMYLCDQRDIGGLRDSPLRTGDSVEFLPVGTTGLAVCVTLIHSSSNSGNNGNNRVESSGSGHSAGVTVTGGNNNSHNHGHNRRDRSESTSSVTHANGGEEHDGIVFKRTIMAPADGKKVVPVAWVVAEGPADNGSIGFAPGWREPPDITGLPWGHLLPPFPMSKK